jgi:hypothetical protein
MKLVLTHDWKDEADKLTRIRKTIADIADLIKH